MKPTKVLNFVSNIRKVMLKFETLFMLEVNRVLEKDNSIVRVKKQYFMFQGKKKHNLIVIYDVNDKYLKNDLYKSGNSFLHISDNFRELCLEVGEKVCDRMKINIDVDFNNTGTIFCFYFRGEREDK